MSRNQTQQLHFSTHYLKSFAEPETKTIEEIPSNIFNGHQKKNVLIIPAYDEDIDFLSRLKNHPASQAIFILVVNQPDDYQDSCARNITLFNDAKQSGDIVWQSDDLYCIQWHNQNHLLLIDRFSENKKIHPKKGVGLARKIACDIAVTLISKKLINSHFIHSTDADATLPDNYFEQTNSLLSPEKISASVYNFKHTNNGCKVDQATNIYEQSMRYYVDGLSWAKSPYAYHTIGSCLAISAKHYCEARGFPQKSGGEDFYLLNKLAKLGRIESLKGEPIILASRESHRVPFGTGPAVSKIISSEKNNAYPSYDPVIFCELKKTLGQLTILADHFSEESAENLAMLQQLSLHSQRALHSLGIETLISHLSSNCKSAQQRHKNIASWFDGFRTLKYIHYLQSNVYPAIPLNQALGDFDNFQREHHTTKS